MRWKVRTKKSQKALSGGDRSLDAAHQRRSRLKTCQHWIKFCRWRTFQCNHRLLRPIITVWRSKSADSNPKMTKLHNLIKQSVWRLSFGISSHFLRNSFDPKNKKNRHSKINRKNGYNNSWLTARSEK